MEKNLNVLKSRTDRLLDLHNDLKHETTVHGTKMKDYYAIYDWLCRSGYVMEDVDSLLADSNQKISNQKMSHLGRGRFNFTRLFETNEFEKLVLRKLKQVEHLIDTCVFDTSVTSTMVKDPPRAGARNKAIQNFKFEQELHSFENDIEHWVKSTERRLTNMEEASVPRSRIIANGEEVNIRDEAEEVTCKLERKIKQLKEALAKDVENAQQRK